MQTQKINISLNGKMLSTRHLTGQSALDALAEMKGLSGDAREDTFPTKASPSDIKRLTCLYAITPSIEGVHGIMMFTRMYGAETVLLIDRDLKVFQIPMENIPSELFKGSLIDGVLTVSKKGDPTFVRSDAWIVAGTDVSALHWGDRVAQMRACFQGFKSRSKDLVKLADWDWPMPESASVAKRLQKVKDDYHTKGYLMAHITSAPGTDFFEIEHSEQGEQLASKIIKTATDLYAKNC
ncbi:mRNA-capping enzyme (mRNA guanylyltransferase) [Acanthocystis turfacea Chlorella virus MN0810.1]|nr:mRNA-capping enzyme (mRNA guanylyltransferase) [Acanthocystis turfacea Chlorella virus MN0810.1]